MNDKKQWEKQREFAMLRLVVKQFHCQYSTKRTTQCTNGDQCGFFDAPFATYCPTLIDGKKHETQKIHKGNINKKQG